MMAMAMAEPNLRSPKPCKLPGTEGGDECQGGEEGGVLQTDGGTEIPAHGGGDDQDDDADTSPYAAGRGQIAEHGGNE